MATLFSLISFVLLVYTILCCINVLLSWFPGAKFTKFGKAVCSITDPYMNFFSKKGLFRIGYFDFSPVISIGILVLLSSIIGGIVTTGRIFFGGILSTIISMIWSLASSLLGILFLLVLIRWIFLKVNKNQTSSTSIWYSIDGFLQNLASKISSTFNKKSISYDKQLLITWIVLLAFLLIGTLLFSQLAQLCLRIPF